MVTLRIWNLAIVGVVLAVLGQSAAAAEPATPPKSECPRECERRAKAAFAFARLKAEAAQPTATPTAPMPKPVQPKVGKLCCCGPDCQCAPGECPGKCPVVSTAATGIASIKLPQPPPVPAAPPQSFAPKRLVGYTCGTDQYGRRVCVPIYEP